MGDRLAIVNWELDAVTIGGVDLYPAAALPFLTEFPHPLITGPEYTPQSMGSIQYRDADTGALLAVHPYPETPDYLPGGHYGMFGNADIAYGPGASAITPEFVYLCGWNDSAIWKLRTNTDEQIWRLDGYQYGHPTPAVAASTVSPVLSADGTRLYVPNDPTNTFVALDTADGSIAATIPVTGSIKPTLGVALAPDGTFVFGWNGNFGDPASARGIYALDPATGTVTQILALSTLGLPYSSFSGDPRINCYQIAPHPTGAGFAFAVQHVQSGPTRYHSTLVEAAWDGTVTNLYNYVASGLDGQRQAMFFAVCYSTDGTKLYACADTSWSILWRFDRGPGSVGGAAPWMHCDYLDRATWIADGSPHSFGTNTAVLWYSVISGVARYRSGALPLRQFQRADSLGGAPRLGRNAPRLPGPNQYR